MTFRGILYRDCTEQELVSSVGSVWAKPFSPEKLVGLLRVAVVVPVQPAHLKMLPDIREHLSAAGLPPSLLPDDRHDQTKFYPYKASQGLFVP